jgi:hypothetical protein
MISDDEYLERIVAGIHSVTSNGADVRWNEIINGRQFDVVVRFDLGTLRYLVLVEVKNRSRRASASDVEAFVTKARDQKANKSVFVSAAGFQSGALEVAARHGLDLFTVGFDEQEALLPRGGTMFVRQLRHRFPGEAPTLELGEPTLVSAIEKVSLSYADGKTYLVPSERSQMTYYVDRTLTGDGRTLNDLIRSATLPTPDLDESADALVDFRPKVKLIPPDEYFFPSGFLTRIRLTVAGRMARPLRGNVLMETTMFRSPVVYTNAATEEVTRLSLEQLPLNNEPIQEGKFYFQYCPLRYFHCAKTHGNSITWEMIESFQCGQLIRVTYVAEASYGAFYIPVTDRKIIRRLERRLRDYRQLRTNESR